MTASATIQTTVTTSSLTPRLTAAARAMSIAGIVG
jgi:hypothetical protein